LRRSGLVLASIIRAGIGRWFFVQPHVREAEKGY
jgi:hypothetical protein